MRAALAVDPAVVSDHHPVAVLNGSVSPWWGWYQFARVDQKERRQLTLEAVVRADAPVDGAQIGLFADLLLEGGEMVRDVSAPFVVRASSVGVWHLISATIDAPRRVRSAVVYVLCRNLKATVWIAQLMLSATIDAAQPNRTAEPTRSCELEPHAACVKVIPCDLRTNGRGAEALPSRTLMMLMLRITLVRHEMAAMS
jgi:hypothetical protein